MYLALAAVEVSVLTAPLTLDLLRRVQVHLEEVFNRLNQVDLGPPLVGVVLALAEALWLKPVPLAVQGGSEKRESYWIVHGHNFVPH